MLQFFSSITDFLATAWQMISNFFSSLITAIIIVTKATATPIYLTEFVPSIIGASIFIVVSVGVVKLLVGWGNQ